MYMDVDEDMDVSRNWGSFKGQVWSKTHRPRRKGEAASKTRDGEKDFTPERSPYNPPA